MFGLDKQVKNRIKSFLATQSVLTAKKTNEIAVYIKIDEKGELTQSLVKEIDASTIEAAKLRDFEINEIV